LEYEHCHTSDKRYADRIKGVYLLGSGWPVGRVAQALMIGRESVRNHHKRYRKGGLMALLRNEADGNGSTSMVSSIATTSAPLSAMTTPLMPNRPSNGSNRLNYKIQEPRGFISSVTTTVATMPS